MTPPWLAGLDARQDAEWIDSTQRGLVLRVRNGRVLEGAHRAVPQPSAAARRATRLESI
jgi:hypothetical protein